MISDCIGAQDCTYRLESAVHFIGWILEAKFRLVGFSKKVNGRVVYLAHAYSA